MGLNNLLSEVMREDAAVTANGKSDESKAQDENEDDSDEDYDKKSDTAVDYSDIVELAEDIQSAMPVGSVSRHFTKFGFDRFYPLLQPPTNADDGEDYDGDGESPTDAATSLSPASTQTSNDLATKTTEENTGEGESTQ